MENVDWLNRVHVGDAREVMATFPNNSIDLSFWSPPYFVGKNYESHLNFQDWKDLLRGVISEHARIMKEGAFMVININDILCFADQNMSRFMANNVSNKKVKISLEHNNVRGGKSSAGTKVLMVGGLLQEWAEAVGLYLYDRRIWHKDPCWANSRWHSNSYR